MELVIPKIVEWDPELISPECDRRLSKNFDSVKAGTFRRWNQDSISQDKGFGLNYLDLKLHILTYKCIATTR